MERYDYKSVERKWQKYWEDHDTFKASNDNSSKKKFYALVEFPYPSGKGMHVGHIRAYSGLEVVSRKRRMEGYNVLFPIGFDAYGLPTDNTAIKENIHPRLITSRNIKKFTNQLKTLGFSFDWSRVIDTTEEEYYKWTQWIFLKMFEKGLVFRDKTNVNYCPSCKVVLSNEDSQGGKCYVCHSDIIQKTKKVWYLRITAYADKLLKGLEEVNYLPNIRLQQENWIGKSNGAFVNFRIKDKNELLRIYTTRPDTLYGVTFMVIAPEHQLIQNYRNSIVNIQALDDYKAACTKKSEFERTQILKEKTGIKINGLTAIHPLTGTEIPIYIADYVMIDYGTGAIMAVPAHDTRDYDFAKKFGIDIIEVIKGGDVTQKAYTGEGEYINSGELNGILDKKDAIAKAIEILEKSKCGENGVQFKMKDWAFNRQRYWGEPIPIVYCDTCGIVAVPYEELPLKLPSIDNFEPGTDGESPLAKIESFVKCKCPKCDKDACRETDTMPQWAGSSWYFIRYCDPKNNEKLASQESLKYWMPVDWYNGGMEHVTRHMIYSRFWYKFLYDLGLVPTSEPYVKRTAHGLILASDGEKMSKSSGNAIDINDIVEEYGADVIRLYNLFIGDYEKASPWRESNIKGCKRFVERVWGLQDIMIDGEDYSKKLKILFHKTIKKVTDDIEKMKFNTAIAAMMTLINQIYNVGSITKAELGSFTIMLYPFAPHISEEIYNVTFDKVLSEQNWITYDESLCVDDIIEIAVQINGKLKAKLHIPVDCNNDTVIAMAMDDEVIKSNIKGKNILKHIYIPNKLVNIVAK